MNLPATMQPRQPSWSGCIRFAVGLCGALIAFTSAQSANTTDDPTGWELLSQYRFKDALLAFEQTGVTAEDQRRAQSLGLALSQLVSPSYNATELPGIVSGLEQIWQANSHDRLGLWAGYYLGRIRQNHASIKADYDGALAWYRRVDEAGEGDLLAQMARLKAIGLVLFAPSDEHRSNEERFEQAEALLESISEPHLQINALVVLANGMLYRGAAADRVFPSFQRAWELGVSDPTARAQILIQMGNLATKIGESDLAVKYYQLFLEENPTEKRNQLVHDQLAMLANLPADE